MDTQAISRTPTETRESGTMDPAPKLLVVDLDGTLLRSDMLHECFWSALKKNWISPLRCLVALLHGRAALKRYLATAATVDVSTLPYEPRVIDFVKDWQASGGQTALVTASDAIVARAVADHLGIFSEAHGSDGQVNLKGTRKAQFLEERYGPKAFTYMGDARPDLHVWRRAGAAITVNASSRLRREAERVCDDVRHLTTDIRSIKPYIKALRPHQWLKNTLVFLPMFAAHNLELTTLLLSLAAFVCFSVIASSVYVLNDLLDLAADRAHPRKRYRPFASGSIPLPHGLWMAAGLVSMGTFLAALIDWPFLIVMVGYFLLTTAYSLNLKQRIVIDICVLAGLYTIRIFAGSIATGIPISVWLLAFSVFFFLSLAAVKRQAELIDSAKRDQLNASGRGYRVDDLPIIAIIAIAAGYVSVLVMILYVNSPAVIELYPQPDALWGVCAILLYWITRIVMLAHRGHMHDDPVVFAVKDRNSFISLFGILVFLLVGTLA